MKTIIQFILIFQTTCLVAQDVQPDSINPLTLSGYGELYYSYDFSNPANHEKPNFIYNHKRHNELSINLIYVKAAYQKQHIRSNLAAMVGDYATYNLAAEPTWAKFIYEANIGVKLSKKHAIWLDAGILPSHIGFESAVSADCWTLTRSILAENSPYFETGIKLSYTNKAETFNAAFLVLNGWQRIRKLTASQQPAIGLQLNYKLNNTLTANYSNFIGTDKPDSLNSLRTFHNFFLQYEPTPRFAAIFGFDVGTDKYNATDYGSWLSPIFVLRYTLNSKTKIALRAEYYGDKSQIIIPTNTANGFQVAGLSSNLDYQLNQKMQVRIEAKMYEATDPVFQEQQAKNYALTTNLTIKL